MPSISEFLGMKIYMYYNEENHMVPHFHVVKAGNEASISISDFTVLEGELQRSDYKAVFEWWGINRFKLMKNWELCKNKEPIEKIPPLK